MKKCRAGWLLLVLAMARVGCAQADAKALQDELKGKKLGLRSYSAEPVAHYDWDGDKIVAVPGRTFAVGVFTASSVKLKNGVVVMTGKRAVIVFDPKKNGLALSPEVPMRLELDLHGAAETAVLPKIKQMLFVEDLPGLVKDLPPPLREMKRMLLGEVAAPCACAHALQDGRWIDIPAKGNADYMFPRVTYQTEPEFSEEARAQKISGSVIVTIFVDDKGRVGDVWLNKPLGFGLDEKAVAAVRTYKFDPATYKGKAVGVVLNIEINFQVF
jgi:TonB family protein